MKLEKIQLNKKLFEPNIISYENRTETCFPHINKNGRFTKVFYKNQEILFKKYKFY